jgi:signal transduction histidine kinase
MIGIFMFSAVTEMHLYRMLVKQTLKDNITIGESILNFINRTPAWQQEDYQQILQETCDLIHLPNKGYICAVDSVGDLIAAPGLTPDRKATLTKASFSSLSRDSLYSFRTFFDSQNFQGYYEYPQSGYSDIISTVEVDSLNIKILVHQSNRLIRKDVREKIRIYYLFGFIMAIIMAIVTYFVIDWRVSKYQKEITKKNDELESKNKQLHAISQEKDVLSSLMAHDLKSPLANITNIVDLLKEMGAINSTQNEMVEYLQQETQRGLLLIEDIMTVSRLESPEYLIEIEDCHITEEWDRFIAGHVQTAANKNINLEVALGHKAIVLESYKQGLFRIFDNLLSNALKYTEAEKRVNVKLQVDEQQFLFSVKDEGPGIPEAELPRLFDKFTKISTVPTANESSTGLGLYTAKLLATKLGGTITVDSKLGSGTTFQLILPLK